MYNPVLVGKDPPYEAEEGSLSLDGMRRVTRYQNIEVAYQNVLGESGERSIPVRFAWQSKTAICATASSTI